jgi:putative sterol carrier protein
MSERKGLLFLSKEWVSKAIAEIEKAKKYNEEVRRKTSEFTVKIAYIVTDIPNILGELYDSKDIVIFIGLDEGRLTEFKVEGDIPSNMVEGVDYTIESDYETLKKIFMGKINVVSAYINKLVKIRPLHKLYINPRFTAKSLTTVSLLLNILRENMDTFYI